MNKLLIIFLLLTLLSCQKNPYEEVGPTSPKKIDPDEKPQGIFEVIGDLNSRNEIGNEGLEGLELLHKFEIHDDLNPDGPFQIYLNGFPEGTRLEKLTANQFILRFTPSWNFVKGQNFVKIDSQIHVVNPDERVIDIPNSWVIYNNPIEPFIFGPSVVLASGARSISFILTAEDLNGEEFPHFSILNPTAQTELVGSEVLLANEAKFIHPMTEFDVTWNSIPDSLAGSVFTVTVQACISTYQKCTTRDVKIDLTSLTPLPTPLPTSIPLPTPAPTPEPTPTPTSNPLPEPTPTIIPIPTLIPTPTLVPTPSIIPAPTLVPEPTLLPAPTLVPEPTLLPSPTPIPQPTPFPTPTFIPQPTQVPTPTFLPTPIPTPIPTPTSTPLPTLMPIPTQNPLPTFVPTPTPTASPVPTAVPKPKPKPKPKPRHPPRHPPRTPS